MFLIAERITYRILNLQVKFRPSGIFVVKQDLILCESYKLRKRCLTSSGFLTERGVCFRGEKQIVAFTENT